DENSSNSTMVDFFKDQMVQQIAADSTSQNSLGIAQMLYEQMKRNYGLDADSLA
ncbi:MAG: rod-binding protein, partial [Acetatifactor sp.]|nr:rod-binding protein [Acetatifactor sp.]